MTEEQFVTELIDFIRKYAHEDCAGQIVYEIYPENLLEFINRILKKKASPVEAN